ncbi:MmoB/DmpM family protein [Emcibacter nanhaiensis]|uniref:Monooxygenase n=1 Tax=Emcibacter nanhaiensis TaxID=1505037 RepID=A0A501PKI6_9PROT|nr:MmoB/DmpM family protein [Emcibacter nanhaiensis]TPD60775.1 monooxygenase [Emcibacter nanhaiensis]
MSRNVSITLQNNDEARPIIEAIEQDNPDATVNIYPAMVKIDCDGRLIVKQSTVEELIGRDWDVQELHLSVISLAGNVDEEDDYLELSWG